MDEFEPFDLKITKLTGSKWDRHNLAHLAEQLMEGQGSPRASVENRVIICFDGSATSDTTFLQANEDLIVRTLVEIANAPHRYAYWLEQYRCWCAIALIRRGQYSSSQDCYYEHPIGEGLREPHKAVFETMVLRKAALLTTNIRPNANPKAHGKDGELRIERLKMTSQKRLL